MSENKLPFWRGFNLLNMFTTKSTGPFLEEDFQLISDWGFNFARLPLCYTLWTEAEDVYRVREDRLQMIDRAVEFGQRYGVHVCINFHRAPGYSVNAERREPFDVWKDQPALDACIFHWNLFAKRYLGISSDELSFNPFNEPMTPKLNPAEGMTRADHERVIRAVVGEIRKIDPGRRIIVDGVNWGNDASPELADLQVAQSCRGYTPFHFTHYKAHWCNISHWPKGGWPFTDPGGKVWDKRALEAFYAPWVKLKDSGVGVHCGEGGAYCFTEHEHVLAWMRDWLETLAAHRIGFALWNLRGSFGVIDSKRQDVSYETVRGLPVDTRMLELLRSIV